MTDTDDLRRLADAHGIQVTFWNVDGHELTLDDDTLRALLDALDVPAATPDDVRASLTALDDGHRSPLPPTIVLSSGHSWHLPEGLSDVVVELEDGGTQVVDGREIPGDL